MLNELKFKYDLFLSSLKKAMNKEGTILGELETFTLSTSMREHFNVTVAEVIASTLEINRQVEKTIFNEFLSLTRLSL